VPFKGDGDFFKVRPNRFGGSPSQAQVRGNALLLTHVRTDHDAEAIKRAYQTTATDIKEYLGWLSEAVDPYNAQLEALITGEVRARKGKLLSDVNMVEAIGLPMKKRGGVPVTYAVPVKRHRTVP
jgi:hypothetical protein